MRRTIIVLCMISGIAAIPISSQAQLGGYVLTDWRAKVEEGSLLWNENRLNLEIDASPVNDAHVFAQFWIRGLGFSSARTTTDLMGLDKRKSNPWDLFLREAYVDLYGFLTDNLDLRIGRQRIAWGTADKINPTDNLNPDDLEDIWDFGRHLGTSSVLATYYWGDVTLSTVLIPAFTPAVLPPPEWASALSASVEMPDGIALGEISDSLILPSNTLKEGGSAAIKIAKPVLNYDLSLSYYRGRSDFPVATQIAITPSAVAGTVDIHSTLIYPRLSVLGADMSGAIGKIGLWAEVAVIYPEAVHTITDMSALGMGQQETVSLPDEHFVRYVIGSDYTFHNGLYVNSQFIHGFPHEMGRDSLHDFIMGGVEKRFYSDKIKLTIAGGAELTDIGNIQDNYALMGMPEIGYFPTDNSEILLGVRLIWASGQTSFGNLADMDEVFLKVKYSF